MTSAPSRGPGEASAPPAPAPSPCTDGDARAQGDGTQQDGCGASLPGPRRALRLTHGNGGPSGTAGGVPGPGGSAACSPGLRSGPEGRLLQQPPGAVPPPRSDGRSHTWAGPEPGLRGGPWVPGQDSAGNRRGRPGEVAREGTEGQLWSCPPPPSSAPHKGPHSRLILGGEAEVPALGHDLQRSAQCTPPLSPPDLCWPWGQHTTPQAWALEGAQPSELLWSRRVHR